MTQDGTGNHSRLLMRLLHTAGEVEGRLAGAVEASGLSLAQLRVLRGLVEKGGTLPLGGLAELLSCVKSNVTQLVDRLEAEGLVRREPDPEDRRSVRAVLTAQGRRRYERAWRARDEAEREIVETLSPEGRGKLAALLDEIRAGTNIAHTK